MNAFYELISGTIIIDKKILAMDLLKKNSNFRYLLNKNKPFYRPPEIENQDGLVKINFDNGTDIDINDSYIKKFKLLKIDHKSAVTGKIYIRVSTNSIFTLTIDFNGLNEAKVY